MCDFRIDAQEMCDKFGTTPARLAQMFDAAQKVFGDMIEVSPKGRRSPRRAGR